MMTSSLMEFPERREITLRDGIQAIARRCGENSQAAETKAMMTA